MDEAAKGYITNQMKGVRIDTQNGRVYLSSIFKWFGEDFIPQFGDTEFFKGKSKNKRAVLNFIRKYLDGEKKTFLESNNFNIQYIKYDWRLNDMDQGHS